MLILSIDIGILHLGLSILEAEEDYSLKEVVWVDLIDITQYKHRHGPCLEKCELRHTRTIADWIAHVVQENQVFFDEADVILLERQPPGTFVAIEQILFMMFREKTVLISPTKMHCHFSISSFTYEERKAYTSKRALACIESKMSHDVLTHFQRTPYERFHDIADSICMALYWLSKKEKEYAVALRRKQLESRVFDDGLTFFQKMDTFRYTKK